MKNISLIKFLKLGSAIMLFFVIAGCNDVMDTQPFNKFSEDIVWSNRTNADAFMFNIYAAIVRDRYTEFVNEEQWTNNSIHVNGNDLTRDQITRESDYGFNQFSRIRRCNLAIEKVTASTGLTDLDKTELIAEAKFLRAMIYYYLTKRFGIVVWVDRVLTTDEDTYKLPTTPDAKTSYGYVIKDLEDAVTGMSETASTGRANKYAAYALLSEVCLQAAAYTGDESLYQKAIDAADAVIGSGKYTLESDYEGMFNETKRYSSEIILGIYRDKTNTNCEGIADMQNVVPNTNNDNIRKTNGGPYFNVDKTFEAWLWWSPSQNIIDDYLVIDQTTQKAVRWDQASQFTANVTKVAAPRTEVKDTGYVTNNSRLNELMYQFRDKRFYASIAYDSCVWFNERVTTCQRGNLYRLVNGALGPHIGLTNYYWRKGVYNVSPRVFYGVPTDYHWVVFRLGKVYLNKAEALLRQGKIADALTALNMTRDLHGGLPPSDATTSAEAWADYKRERRVDLAKEGDYYWSLLRWGKYGGDANGGAAPGAKIAELVEVPTYMEISKNRKRYRIEEISHSQNNVRKFDETRRYLFPIPQGERNKNENLGQNPNW